MKYLMYLVELFDLHRVINYVNINCKGGKKMFIVRLFKNLLKKITIFIPDKLYLKLFYFIKFKKILNFTKPITFNEKLQYLKVKQIDNKFTIMADKYKAREYVKERIGEEILIPLLWVGDKGEDIPFDTLPNSFVIKCNHASGTNIIVKDKSEINREEIIKRLRKWLKVNYYWGRREIVYKNINRKIIIEKYLEGENQILDYRFFCFDGVPKFICVDFNIIDKTKASTKRNLYDLEWNLMEEKMTYPNSDTELKRPIHLNILIQYAKVLSKDFKHVRVDFFIIGDKIYFGETTFYHQSGFFEFYPNHQELDKKFGELLNL